MFPSFRTVEVIVDEQNNVRAEYAHRPRWREAFVQSHPLDPNVVRARYETELRPNLGNPNPQSGSFQFRGYQGKFQGN
jgi:hypothetical protein